MPRSQIDQNPGSIQVGLKVLSDFSMGATQPNPELSCDQSWDEVEKTDKKIKTLKMGNERD